MVPFGYGNTYGLSGSSSNFLNRIRVTADGDTCEVAIDLYAHGRDSPVSDSDADWFRSGTHPVDLACEQVESGYFTSSLIYDSLTPWSNYRYRTTSEDTKTRNPTSPFIEDRTRPTPDTPSDIPVPGPSEPDPDPTGGDDEVRMCDDVYYRVEGRLCDTKCSDCTTTDQAMCEADDGVGGTWYENAVLVCVGGGTVTFPGVLTDTEGGIDLSELLAEVQRLEEAIERLTRGGDSFGRCAQSNYVTRQACEDAGQVWTVIESLVGETARDQVMEILGKIRGFACLGGLGSLLSQSGPIGSVRVRTPLI